VWRHWALQQHKEVSSWALKTVKSPRCPSAVFPRSLVLPSAKRFLKLAAATGQVRLGLLLNQVPCVQPICGVPPRQCGLVGAVPQLYATPKSTLSHLKKSRL
jgi:hypothetical protein